MTTTALAGVACTIIIVAAVATHWWFIRSRIRDIEYDARAACSRAALRRAYYQLTDLHHIAGGSLFMLGNQRYLYHVYGIIAKRNADICSEQ